MVKKILEKIKKKDSLCKFIKYCFIGFFGAFLDFILYGLFTTIFDFHYLIVNIFSVSVGITNNFFLNAYFNFKITNKLFARFVSFYSVGLFGLLISEILLFVLVEKIGISEVIAKIISIFAIILVQFFLNKKITFRVRG